MALRDALDGLEARVDQHYDQLKSVRGMISRSLRREKPVEDAPDEAIEEQPDTRVPPRALSTAHLSRRFRVGG